MVQEKATYVLYRGRRIFIKGSVYVFKYALPPFSPPLSAEVQISKQNRHRTYDIINTFTIVHGSAIALNRHLYAA